MKFYGLKYRGKTSCTNFTEIECLVGQDILHEL